VAQWGDGRPNVPPQKAHILTQLTASLVFLCFVAVVGGAAARVAWFLVLTGWNFGR
jgi:hypothetical protein